MIKAAIDLPGDRTLVLLGLTGENITRICAGEPIAFNAATLGVGLDDVAISVAYGRDQSDIAEQLASGGLLDRIKATPWDTERPMQPVPTADHIDVRQIVLEDIAADPIAADQYMTDPAFKLSIETVIGTLDRILDCVAETGRHDPDELEALAHTMVRRLSGSSDDRAEDSAVIAHAAALLTPDPTTPPAVTITTVLGVQDPTFYAPASPSGITGTGVRALQQALAESGFEILHGPTRANPQAPLPG